MHPFRAPWASPGRPSGAQDASKAPQERSQTLLETLPELPSWPPEPSKSFQMASGTIWAPQERSPWRRFQSSHFGLPSPPSPFLTPSGRLKSAPRRSWRRFQSSHFGLPSPPSPSRSRQEPSGLHFRSNVDRFWRCLGMFFGRLFASSSLVNGKCECS